MSLHRLKITALGPYPGTREVDFGVLNGAGVSLVHGVTVHGTTRAGKTGVFEVAGVGS